MSLFDKEIPPEYLRILQQFRFIDDTFFAACLDGDIPCMELILRLVLQRSDIGVQSVVTQQSAQNLYGRGVRFDALARDRAGKIYNCEVQRADEGAIPRRARYNNCLVDHRELAKGAAFKEPLINARFFHLLLKWMRTYLLLRRRGTAKRWKRCGRAEECAGNHHSRRNTSSAIATLGTPGDATGIPR